MGRDSESFSTSRGLLRSANSTRRSTILCELSREPRPPPAASRESRLLPPVGRLTCTAEEQIHELFGKSGGIGKAMVVLEKAKKTVCSFCSGEYPSEILKMQCISGTRADDRIIRVDWDAGCEYRQDCDAGRYSYGKTVQCQTRSRL
uniref:Nuclear cap-binding protein subunit 2 n=1 Tax=Falco tinnunculus TaxID=100819 RepID=A0A8C4TRZ7_FALTI